MPSRPRFAAVILASAAMSLGLAAGCSSPASQEATTGGSASTGKTPASVADPHGKDTSKTADSGAKSSTQTGPGSGSPAPDPCQVLTKDIAAAALGVAVKEPPRTFTNGPSNSCVWSSASGKRATVQLTLFTDAARKDAGYDDSKKQLGGRDITGIGDRAFYGGGQLQVRKGDWYLAILLGTSGGQPTDDQLRTVANAVLANLG